jgi:hypothetical protein
MGLFVRNKTKRVKKPYDDTPVLINTTQTPILIGEEVIVVEKMGIKSGFGNKKPIQVDDKKTVIDNISVADKTNNKIVTTFNNPKPIESESFFKKEVGKPVKVKDRFANLDLALMDIQDFEDFIKDKTIILVANSSDLLTRENGWFIDNHDIIIRFNSFLIDGKYTGIETTMHVVHEIMDSCFEYYTPIRFVLSTTDNLSKLGRYNQSYLLKCDHNTYNFVFTNEEKEIIPTSGFKILRLLLKLGGFYKINLIGFTFYEGGDSSVFRSVGGISKVHDYNYERDYIFNNCNHYDKDNNIITFLK